MYPKRSKYNNKKITVDGTAFDSKKEAAHYLLLKDRLNIGEIKLLSLQPSFTLQEGFRYEGKAIRPIKYIADFMYHEGDTVVVVDVKGFKTEVYNLKKKMFLSRYRQMKFIEI